MAVYVDKIFLWPADLVKDSQARRLTLKNGGQWCHMWADTPEELHDLAERIGLKRKWAQHENIPHKLHYDLTPARRVKALKAGAVESSRREWYQRIREQAANGELK